jgi:hypothetical protein
LVELMPELFDNPQGEELDEEVQVFYLCRLLKVLRGSLLPHVTHDIEASVEDLLTAISQHFKAIGGLQGEQSLRNLEMGYYEKDATGLKISCRVDPRPEEEKVKMDLNHCDQIAIVQPLDPMTLVKCTTQNVTMKIDSIHKEFVDGGADLPTLEVSWKGALLTDKKRPETTPKKRKTPSRSPTDEGPGGSTDPNAFASKSGVALQAALRAKMAKKS